MAGLVLLAPVLRGEFMSARSRLNRRLARIPRQMAVWRSTISLCPPKRSMRSVPWICAGSLCPAAATCWCMRGRRSPVLSECITAWTSGNAEVEVKNFDAFEAMLRPDFMSHEPHAEVGCVVAWLEDRLCSVRETSPVRWSATPELLRLGGCIETPLRFGPNDRLFGILCRPSRRPEVPVAVVIPNTSGAPHYGFAHTTVGLARRLAASGVASLRIDFDGVGDSGTPRDSPPAHVFESDRRPDVAAAIDALEAMGFRHFAVQGLCSGAYHALHATLADPRISRQILVNLPLFQWRAGDAIELMASGDLRVWTELLGEVFRISVAACKVENCPTSRASVWSVWSGWIGECGSRGGSRQWDQGWSGSQRRKRASPGPI